MCMSKKLGQISSLYWTIASIISVCFAIVCRIGSLEIYVKQYDYTKLYSTELYDNILSLSHGLFVIAYLAFGTIAIVQIIKNWKARVISGIIELLILVFVGFYLLGFTLVVPQYYRSRKAISGSMLIQIREVGNSINQYSKKYNHMPEAFWWCDLLIDDPNVGISKHDFHVGQLPLIECNFAFNKKLSSLPVDGLPGNVVVLFEADGELNLSGGPELISRERTKDKYFMFKRQRFIYVLFIDGTIAKYRLYDGAVALYDPDKNEFTDYHKKGQTPYSPLRWE